MRILVSSVTALAMILPATQITTSVQAVLAVAAPVVLALAADSAEARGGRRGGGGHVRSSGQHNVHRNANVNRNVNANRNRNVNRNVNVNGSRHIDVDVDHHYHNGGGFVAGVATAMVIGAIVRTLPPNCQTIVVDGVGYKQCGGNWYAPQYSGSSVTYVVITDPR